MENAAPPVSGALHSTSKSILVSRNGNGEPVHLTNSELRLLQMLSQAGRAVSTDRLLIQVWGHRDAATASC